MYEIAITEYAIRQLKKIDRRVMPAIKNAIAELAHNSRPRSHIKLTNVEAYRIRVGSFRVIYEIDDTALTVLVVEIANRKEVYRKK